MTIARGSAAALAVMIALAPRVSRADAASEAELQFELGNELYKQKRYEEALQHLISSNRLVPNANVVFNIALIYGVLKRDAEAFNWYQSYLEFSTLDDAGRERGLKAAAGLQPKVSVLDVTSTPPGAELFIDRVDLGSVGKTPRKVAVAAGDHAVIAQSSGYHEARAQVTAVAGGGVAVPLTLTPIVGTLLVESEPPGATVKREGSSEALGVTPLKLTLPLGEIRLQLELEGHVEQQRQAIIREEQEATVKVQLVAAASTVSVLSVAGSPEGARVRLEGKDLGAVPLVASGLKPGAFTLEVDAPAKEAFSQRIVLEPGAATRVDVRLEPPNGGPWRWLHWAGYGAGAAAVIAGAIVAAVAISNRNTFYSSPSRETYDLVNSQNVAADSLIISGLLVAAVTFVLDRFVWPVQHTHATVEVAR